jgi:adenylate cyclase
VIPLAERPAVYTPGIAAGVFLAILGLLKLGVLQPLELALYDRMIVARGEARPPEERVALIGATEDDIAKLGWPSTDETLASLLEIVLKQEPRAIGIDIYRDHPRPPGAERFSQVLTSHKNIIGVQKIGAPGEPGVAPPPPLVGTEQIGVADVAGDPGGVVRRGMLFLDDDKGTHFSFGLRLALLYLAPQGIVPGPGEPDPTHIRLGASTLPPFEPDDGGYVGADAAGYQFLLDFAGGALPFKRFSYSEVLEGKTPPAAFRDKVVIVGVTAPSVKDFFETPYSFDHDSPTVHGITMHGHIVSNLVRMALGEARPLRVFPEWMELAWMALLSLGGALAGARLRGIGGFGVAALLGVALLGGLSYAVFQYGAWLPMVPPALAWLASLSLVTAYALHIQRAQQSQLMGIFSRYMGQDMAKDVWQRRAEFLGEGGRPKPLRLEATVLFSDIKGFTAVSEKLDPAGLMEWLNSYMEAMAGLVMKHGGVVDKFIGDAVMAVFGVPVARTTKEQVAADARAAVSCALAMREELTRFNAAWASRSVPPIGIRVGIFTGELVSGSLGSTDKMEYTVIGDTVNTASRLESFKLEEGELPPEALAAEAEGTCRILIGEATLSLIGEGYEVAVVGEVRLKGKEHPVRVYSVVAQH